MYVEKNTKILWEIVGYITLALCICGQITVGYFYLLAQSVYLVANIASVIRDFKLDLPTANKIKDFVFSAISIALIIIYLVK